MHKLTSLHDQLPTHSKVLAFTSQNVNFAIGKHCLKVIGSAFVLLRIHVDETTKYVKLTKNFEQKVYEGIFPRSTSL